MIKQPRTVNCPRCGNVVEWRPESRWRPFCSERCKLFDLGAWANEEYRVPDDGKPGEARSQRDHEPRSRDDT